MVCAIVTSLRRPCPALRTINWRNLRDIGSGTKRPCSIISSPLSSTSTPNPSPCLTVARHAHYSSNPSWPRCAVRTDEDPGKEIPQTRSGAQRSSSSKQCRSAVQQQQQQHVRLWCKYRRRGP